VREHRHKWHFNPNMDNERSGPTRVGFICDDCQEQMTLTKAEAILDGREAAKAREEAGNLMAECLRSMDGVDTQGPILAATIHFLLRDDVRAAVDKWQAASEPPGTARQSLGEEGT